MGHQGSDTLYMYKGSADLCPVVEAEPASNWNFSKTARCSEERTVSSFSKALAGQLAKSEDIVSK